MEEGEQVTDAMERSQRNIDKKITKLEYYTEPVDELIESNDYLEMEIAVKPGKQIGDKITVLFHSWKALSWTLEFRLEKFSNGKKDKKNIFARFIQERDRISEVLSAKQRQKKDEIERKNGRLTGGGRSAWHEKDNNKRRHSGRRSFKLSCA